MFAPWMCRRLRAAVFIKATAYMRAAWITWSRYRQIHWPGCKLLIIVQICWPILVIAVCCCHCINVVYLSADGGLRGHSASDWCLLGGNQQPDCKTITLILHHICCPALTSVPPNTHVLCSSEYAKRGRVLQGSILPFPWHKHLWWRLRMFQQSSLKSQDCSCEISRQAETLQTQIFTWKQ